MAYTPMTGAPKTGAPTPSTPIQAKGLTEVSGMKKFGKALIGGTWQDIKAHAVYDVVIPGIKKMALDAISILLFGTPTQNRTTNPWGGVASPWGNPWATPTGIDYRSYYGIANGFGNLNAPKAAAPASTSLYKTNFSYADPIFSTSDMADEFRDKVRDIMESNGGYITCACFYDNCGMSGYPPTAVQFGWKNLSQVMAAKTVSKMQPNGEIGYILQMPQPVPLSSTQV